MTEQKRRYNSDMRFLLACPIFFCSLYLPTRSYGQSAQDVQSSNAATAQVGKIKGIVTYYFNNNYGDKADVGANILLFQGDVSIPADSVVFLDKEKISVTSAEAFKAFVAAQKQDAAAKPESLKLVAIDQTTVDANGNFSFDEVPPGHYTVVIKSSHSNDLPLHSRRDILGRYKFHSLDVRPGRTTDASEACPASAM